MDPSSRRLLDLFDAAGDAAGQLRGVPDPGESWEAFDERRWLQGAWLYGAAAEVRRVIFPGPYPEAYEWGYRQGLTRLPNSAIDIYGTADVFDWDYADNAESDPFLLSYSDAIQLAEDQRTHPRAEDEQSPTPSYWDELSKQAERVGLSIGGAAGDVVAGAAGSLLSSPAVKWIAGAWLASKFFKR